MNNQVNILDKEQMKASLSVLRPDAVPLWGKMKPQQMIEHLVESVEYTNGKNVSVCDRPTEKAEAAKQSGLQPDFVIPHNINLGPLPENYRFVTLDSAVSQLLLELEDFDSYFKAPDIKSIHFAFGPMDRQEWLIWHGKHFIHHFRQFGISGF